jgi:hypothetical protein
VRDRGSARFASRAPRRLLELARADPIAAVAIVAGLLARLVHWLVAERRFEDSLITITHARNVVEGIGLTHHPFEPVTHGFTSVLSVLIPLAGELVGEVVRGVDGFLALRVASLAAFVATLLIANAICHRLGVSRGPRAFALGFLAIDYNQVFYGMAGMETQLAVAILLGAVLATMDRRAIAAGVLYGLCILVRPDFAIFVAPALGSLFLWRRRQALVAAGTAIALVAPWLLFATLYYGSPVPNSVRAKALLSREDYPSLLDPGGWVSFLGDQIGERQTWWHTFTPFLENGFVVDTPAPQLILQAIATTFIALALIGAVSSARRPGWGAAVAYLGLFVAYLFLVLPEYYYEWYYPPFMALAVICLAAGLTHLFRHGAVGVQRVPNGVACLLLVAFAWPYPYHLVVDSKIQHDIEDRVRVRLGRWLGGHVPPGATVTSESAGYVGYYGGVKLYDYPGLTSMQALRVLQRLSPERYSMFDLIRAASPEFVVLRPYELRAFREGYKSVAQRYRRVARFAVPFERTMASWGGVSYLNIDREFVVLRRALATPAS